MTTEPTLDLNIPSAQGVDSVDEYRFEPIAGYPMLNWRGKRPFTNTNYYPAQLKERHGEGVNGWLNQIFWGDNLQVMSHLLKEYRGKVNLVYIDPPFDSKADYKKKISLKGKQITNDQNTFEEKQYTDIWTNDEYLQFMYERLILIRELLAEDGLALVHVDQTQVHKIRFLLDEIFGENNFRNEIIWHYGQRTSIRDKRLDAKHDNLLLYAKSGSAKIYKSTIEWDYDEFISHRHDVMTDETGRKYILSDAGSKGRYVRYVEEVIAAGKPVDTVWDLPLLNSSDKQRTGYPTQKPDYLIERIIDFFSDKNQLVFDCFMGSGTTQAVAMKLGRRFIGSDINLGAVQITTKRLLGIAADLKQKKQQTELDLTETDDAEPTTYYTGVEVYNVNHYDVFRNPIQAKELLIEALELHPLTQSNLYDGEKDGRMYKIMPVNRIATRVDLNELNAGLDRKTFEKRHNENPNKPVEHLTLVCMGHEPNLAAELQKDLMPYKLDIEVVDILRDRQDLQFKRDSEAKIEIKGSQLVIEKFYPMNLLSKLSLQKEKVEDWRELVESIMIDWNYDGAILEPAVTDIPGKNELVSGTYDIPKDAGTIKVKITDLLSESLEMEVHHA